MDAKIEEKATQNVMEAFARTSSLETVYSLHLFWPASGKTSPATKDKDSSIHIFLLAFRLKIKTI